MSTHVFDYLKPKNKDLLLYCVGSADEFVVIFVHQHLKVSVEIFNFSSHFHMFLEKPLQIWFLYLQN